MSQRRRKSGIMLMQIGISINKRSCRLTADNPPISQKVIAGNLLKGSATYFVSEMKALRREDTTIPVRTRTKREESSSENIIVIKHVRATARMPNIKENNCISNDPADIRIAATAPKPAPDEAPKMSGETIGFLKIP
jgi:hypothetical protein